MRIQVIDSHTGGEPTRTIVGGFPALQGSTAIERRDDFQRRFDHLRTGILNEPRGSSILVGALLTESNGPNCQFGLIFFNNAGMLGMCGHGTIGVVETLRHMRKIEVGITNFETPAGIVSAELFSDGTIAIQNVVSFRYREGIRIEVEGREVIGDIAYGGNWFFLVTSPKLELKLDRIDSLSRFTILIMKQLTDDGITGSGGAKIDHVELYSPSDIADSKNFVMCPGGEFDRSPCGTGTSAKMACLFESGKLKENQVWRQESITGSVFEGSVQLDDVKIIPTIRGCAFVTAEAELIFEENDPLRWGQRI